MYKNHWKIMGGVGAMRFSLYSSSSDICLSKLLLFGKFLFFKSFKFIFVSMMRNNALSFKDNPSYGIFYKKLHILSDELLQQYFLLQYCNK